MTRYAELDGRRLAYDVAGAGDPPIVFVHGWSCDRSYFGPQFRHFAGRHTVAALDLRGHGESDPGPAYDTGAFADDVLTVAAAAGLPRPVVVGHSLGALVALACAARPDAVRAAVLVDPAPVLPGRGKSFFARSAEAVAADADGSWRAAFVDRLFGPHDTVHRAETTTAIAATPRAVSAAAWQAIVDFDGAAILPRVPVPVLLVTAGPPEAGVAEQLADVTLGRTVDAGHFLQLEVPDQLNPMIERFLAIRTISR